MKIVNSKFAICNCENCKLSNWNVYNLVIYYLSHYQNFYWRRTAEDLEMSHESSRSSFGGSRKQRIRSQSRLPSSDTHGVYSSANGEHYQMYDCNVEMHEDWTKTLRVVDIIYPSGPGRGVRIMYELKNY